VVHHAQIEVLEFSSVPEARATRPANDPFVADPDIGSDDRVGSAAVLTVRGWRWERPSWRRPRCSGSRTPRFLRQTRSRSDPLTALVKWSVTAASCFAVTTVSAGEVIEIGSLRGCRPNLPR